MRNALAASWAFTAANTPILLQYVGTGITTAFACQLGAAMPTATIPGVTGHHSYVDDLITEKTISEIREFLNKPIVDSTEQEERTTTYSPILTNV